MVFWRKWLSRFRRPSSGITMTELTENASFLSLCNSRLRIPNFTGVILQQFQPKCLPSLDYTSFLHERVVEDFSSDCWLENHLHQFAQHPDMVQMGDVNISNGSVYTVRSSSSSGSDWTSSWSSSQGTLGFGSFSSDWWNSLIDARASPPPPYSEEPPPTYEEATQTQRFPNDDLRDDFCW